MTLPNRYTLSALVVVSALLGCSGDGKPDKRRGADTKASAGDVAQSGDSVGATTSFPPLPPANASAGQQHETLTRAADAAWAYVRRNYSEATGLVKTHETYEYATMWDNASAIASYYCARELGLLSHAEYESRVRKALNTLASMRLYDGVAFNKLYDARSGVMVDRQTHRSSTGYGWSAVDLGRLLIWLRIISAHDPELTPQTRAVVSRIAMNQIVHDGYLHGRDIDPASGTEQDYVEGRIGYEQYAAAGYASWGYSAERALDFRTNQQLVTIDGVQIPADKRGNDLLTSDPFVMMGMEMGWPNAAWRETSRRIFDAQYERYKRTGVLTVVGEDAMPDPPSYFYYYVLYRNGAPFTVVGGTGAPAPEHVRWVSAKAAYGWYALLPSDYSWRAVQAVQRASSQSRGWTAGIYEESNEPTHSFNLNTSAVILEAALYAKTRCPFIETDCDTSSTTPADANARR